MRQSFAPLWDFAESQGVDVASSEGTRNSHAKLGAGARR